MKTNLVYLIGLVILLTCSKNKTVSGDNEILQVKQSGDEHLRISGNGILILASDSAYLREYIFYILNQDGNVFCQIKSIDGNEPSCDVLDGKILAYYPDYYIIHFDAENSKDAFYRIRVGADIKLIKKEKYMRFLTWQEYVLMFFCTTTEDNPLRGKPSVSSNALPNLNYEELNFRCAEISGDWVKVICNNDCEGCPDNDIVKGWIRWRKEGKVIINQYYTC